MLLFQLKIMHFNSSEQKYNDSFCNFMKYNIEKKEKMAVINLYSHVRWFYSIRLNFDIINQ